MSFAPLTPPPTPSRASYHHPHLKGTPPTQLARRPPSSPPPPPAPAPHPRGSIGGPLRHSQAVRNLSLFTACAVSESAIPPCWPGDADEQEVVGSRPFGAGRPLSPLLPSATFSRPELVLSLFPPPSSSSPSSSTPSVSPPATPRLPYTRAFPPTAHLHLTVLPSPLSPPLGSLSHAAPASSTVAQLKSYLSSALDLPRLGLDAQHIDILLPPPEVDEDLALKRRVSAPARAATPLQDDLPLSAYGVGCPFHTDELLVCIGGARSTSSLASI